MPSTPTASIDALHAFETARVALAAELARVTLEVRQLRALRLHSELEPAIGLVHGTTDEDYAARAARLAEALGTAGTLRRNH